MDKCPYNVSDVKIGPSPNLFIKAPLKSSHFLSIVVLHVDKSVLLPAIKILSSASKISLAMNTKY